MLNSKSEYFSSKIEHDLFQERDMKNLKSILLLGLIVLGLSACGRNNRVGNNGGPGGVFTAGSGILGQGQSTGSGLVDSFISQVNCQGGNGNNRVFMTFQCQNGGCTRSGGTSGYNNLIGQQLRLGRTAYGDVAIVRYNGPSSAEMTFLMCQDGIFNQNTVMNTQIAGLQVLNSNVSSNINGGYGQFIANVWFGMQFSNQLIKASFY
jgi:hypothetical protein